MASNYDSHGICRIVYIHAGKNKGTKQLKQDRHHIALFYDTMHLCFAKDPEYDHKQQTPDSSPCQLIEDLPRGQILGVMVLTEAFWFKRDQHTHLDEWILGPFVYTIGDVVRLEEGVAVDGQLGKWSPSKEIHQQIMQQTSVQRKLEQWQLQYGDRLYVGESDIPCAMTIHQPFVEAILSRLKKYENRKRPMFPLHPLLKPSPPSPDMTECRFCLSPQPQIAQTKTTSTTTTTLKCTYWAHSVKSASAAKQTLVHGNEASSSKLKRERTDSVDMTMSSSVHHKKLKLNTFNTQMLQTKRQSVCSHYLCGFMQSSCFFVSN